MKNKKLFKILALVMTTIILCAAVGIGISAAVGAHAAKVGYKKELASLKQEGVTVKESMTITAHTGATSTKENSIESIEVGCENADIIEFDLNFFEDGTPVLSHDKPKKKAVTFEKALETVAKSSDTVQMNIDIKSTENLAEVQRLLKEYNLLDRAFFTGVKVDFVEAVKKDAPEVPYYLNVEINKKKAKDSEYADKIVKKLEKYGAIGLNVSFDSMTKPLAKAVQENGYLLSLWTARTELQVFKLLKFSPDNITTTIPEKVQEIIANDSVKI